MNSTLWRRLEALEGSGGPETFIRWRMSDGREVFQPLRAGGVLVDTAPTGSRVIGWPVPFPRVEVRHADA